MMWNDKEPLVSFVHEGYTYLIGTYVKTQWSPSTLVNDSVRMDGIVFRIKSLSRMGNTVYATLTPIWSPLQIEKRYIQEIETPIWSVLPVTLLELAAARNDLDELINAYVTDNS